MRWKHGKLLGNLGNGLEALGGSRALESPLLARIEDEAERTRLKQLLTEAMPQTISGGYIVRTAAQRAFATTCSTS